MRIGGGQLGAQLSGLARVLKESKVHGLLMWLDAPRDGVVCAHIDPTHEVGLAGC